jgi:hypothetical protein
MDFLQAKLNFEGWQSPQFESSEGLGRIGLSGFLLGIFFGAHLTLVVLSALVDIPPVLVSGDNHAEYQNMSSVRIRYSGHSTLFACQVCGVL